MKKLIFIFAALFLLLFAGMASAADEYDLASYYPDLNIFGPTSSD